MHRHGLLWQLSLRTLRFYSSQAPPTSTKGLLATLRRKTGFPIGKCKQALTQHDNNIEAAEKWLYSQAQKEGWVKLEKLQGRATKQGLIGVIVRENRAAMVEVNCETDFVARNEKFQALVSSVTGAILANNLHGLLSTAELPSTNHLTREALVNITTVTDTKTLADLVAEYVGHLSENISITRACTVGTTRGLVCSYVYNNLRPPGEEVAVGTYAALLHLLPKEQEEFDNVDAAVTLGRQLCQHVVGMNPQAVDVGGEVKESQALLYQDFLLDSDVTVKSLLERNDVQVTQFVRYALGESTPEQ